jgi:hypothetical protein
MNKALIPLTLAAVLFAGYSLNRLKGDHHPQGITGLVDQDLCLSEAALRHKHNEPSHWRALILRN